jgi:phage-related tail fiber protein
MNEYSVITKQRRIALCRASSDASQPLAAITHIAFGSGGTDESGEPLTPLDTQTELRSEIARFAIDGVTYPEETTARYTVTIPKNEHTGESFSEAALVDSTGKLAAIKNMYPKRKDEDVAFVFEFDDEF